MTKASRIDKDAVLAATEGGKAVILDYYPQAAAAFASGGRKSKYNHFMLENRNKSVTLLMQRYTVIGAIKKFIRAFCEPERPVSYCLGSMSLQRRRPVFYV